MSQIKYMSIKEDLKGAVISANAVVMNNVSPNKIVQAGTEWKCESILENEQ